MTTKQETILYINHAISYYKNQGKTQKDMAKALNIDESRISEMKAGRSKLSPSDKQEIIEICGHPRRDPGRYVCAHYYQDFETFKSEFNDLVENTYVRQLIEYFKEEKNIQRLLADCQPSAQWSLLSSERQNLSEVSLIDLDDLIRSEYCRELFTQYRSELTKKDSDFRGKQIKHNDISITEKETFERLYLLWLLTHYYPDFFLSAKTVVNLNPHKDLEELVLTGSNVLAFQNIHSRPNSKSYHHPINSETLTRFGYNMHNSFRSYSPESRLRIPTWDALRCEVILSEEMNYFFTIHLSESDTRYEVLSESVNYIPNADPAIEIGYADLDDLFVVIGVIPSQDLLKEIEEVRKWFCLPEDSHFELKRNIAKAGGYVPGARVLV